MDRQKIKLIAVAIEEIEKLEETIENLKNQNNLIIEIPQHLIKDEDIRKAIIKALEKKLDAQNKELDAFMKEGTNA